MGGSLVIHGLRKEIHDERRYFLAYSGLAARSLPAPSLICPLKPVAGSGSMAAASSAVSSMLLKSGGRWVDATDVFGLREILYNRFVRLASKGVWTDLFHVPYNSRWLSCACSAASRTTATS